MTALTGLVSAVAGQTPTFSLTTYATGPTNSQPNTYSVAVADVNGDGKADVLATNVSSNTLAVLLGNGSGSFALQANSPSTGANSNPYSLAVADVNGDGKLDVLTANSSTSTLGVLLGDGVGGFTLQAGSPSTGAGSSPYRVVLVDVNGDGKLDALTLNNGTGTVGVLLGNGSGGFTLQAGSASVGASSNPYSLAVADVNGDGKLDALTANTGSHTMGMLLGNGSGGFTLQSPATSTGPNTGPFGVATADVNGDGKLDALITNGFTATLGVLLGNGSGGFTLQANASSTGQNNGPISVALTDVNGDGKLDALTANNSGGGVSVLLGNGSGGFMLQSPIVSTGGNSHPITLTVADVNGDRKPDVLTASSNTSTLSVLLNTTTFLATQPALPGASALLAPNPTHAAATLLATGLPAATHTLTGTMYNELGQSVRHLLLLAGSGAVQADVPTANLPAGMYLLHLTALDAQGVTLGTLPTQRLSIE